MLLPINHDAEPFTLLWHYFKSFASGRFRVITVD